jgi:hypothetical protein
MKTSCKQAFVITLFFLLPIILWCQSSLNGGAKLDTLEGISDENLLTAPSVSSDSNTIKNLPLFLNQSDINVYRKRWGKVSGKINSMYFVTTPGRVYQSLTRPVYFNADTLAFLSIGEQNGIQELNLSSQEVTSITYQGFQHKAVASDYFLPAGGWFFWMLRENIGYDVANVVVEGLLGLILNTFLSSELKGRMTIAESDYRKLAKRNYNMSVTANIVSTDSDDYGFYQIQYPRYYMNWGLSLRFKNTFSFSTHSLSLSFGKGQYEETRRVYYYSYSGIIYRKETYSYLTLKLLSEYSLLDVNRLRTTIGIGSWGYLALGNNTPWREDSQFHGLLELGIHYQLRPTLSIGGLYPLVFLLDNGYKNTFKPVFSLQVTYTPLNPRPLFSINSDISLSVVPYYQLRNISKTYYEREDKKMALVPAWGLQFHYTVKDRSVLILQIQESSAYFEDYDEAIDSEVFRRDKVSGLAFKFKHSFSGLNIKSYDLIPSYFWGVGFGRAVSCGDVFEFLSFPVGGALELSLPNGITLHWQVELPIFTVGETIYIDSYTFGISLPLIRK